MPIFYPQQEFGDFFLSLGITSSLLHRQFGISFDERYYRDVVYRVRTQMELDRLVYEHFSDIGIGYAEPFPRINIEPFGHRFIPVLYRCECLYSDDEEPWVSKRNLCAKEIETLPSWTLERFENSPAVKEVVAQARVLREHYEIDTKRTNFNYNPHYKPLSSLQNLGSVINTACSVFGEEVFILYLENPELLKKLFANITDLMLLCLDYFPRIDDESLQTIFVGNCTVAMISPEHYRRCNFEYDLQLVNYAKRNNLRFMVHQDSDASEHLENYDKLKYVHALDIGQDTDFEKLAALFPQCDVSCILFPSWLITTSLEEIREELTRIMTLGSAFRSFAFSVFEIDPVLAQGRIFEFYDIFRDCAVAVSRRHRA